MFETFKRSHNLKAWLRFAPRRGKKFPASYCRRIRSVVAILTVCHRILSYLLWYSTMVSVGCSVRSYVCADLLNTREGSPSKGGCICTPLFYPAREVTIFIRMYYARPFLRGDRLRTFCIHPQVNKRGA